MARKKRNMAPAEVAEPDGSASETDEVSDFEQILDSDSNALLVVESESRQVLWCNRGAEKLLRKKRDQLLAEPFPEEIEEGPMRTFDLNRSIHALQWQGQSAVLVRLTQMSSGGANFALEWRLEAAEERARDAEEQLATLQAQIKSHDGEGELRAEAEKAQQRISQLERELRACEGRAEKAEDRAKEAEQLMEEAESQAQETEKHLEDLSDTVRNIEEQLQQERQRNQELEKNSAQAADQARLQQENQSLRQQTQVLQQEIDDLLARQVEQEEMALQASGEAGELQQQVNEWRKKESEWKLREQEIEELEVVHLQVMTELEQLRLERQNWQEAPVATVDSAELGELSTRLRELQERYDFVEIERAEAEECWLESKAELEQLQEHIQLQQSQQEDLGQVRAELLQVQQQAQSWQDQAQELAALLQEAEASATLQAELHQESGQLQQKLQNSQLEVERLRGEVDSSQEQLLELQALLEESQRDKDGGLQEWEREKQAWQRERAELRDTVDELEGLLEDLRSRAQASLDELALAQQRYAALEAEMGSTGDLSQELEDVQQHLLVVERERDDLLSQLDEAESVGAKYQEQLSALTPLQERCQELEERLLEVPSLQDELLRFQEMCAGLQGQLEQSQGALAEQTALQEQLTALQAQADAELEKCLAQAEVVAAFEEQNQQLIDERQQLSLKVQELEKAASQAEQLSSQIGELQVHSEQVESLQKKCASLQEQLDELAEEMAEAQTQEGLLQGQLREAQQRCRELEERVDSAEPHAADSELEEQLLQLQTELENSASASALEIARWQEQTQQLQEEVGRLQSQLGSSEQSDSRVAELEAELDELRSAPPAADPRVAELEAELAELRSAPPAADPRVADMEAELALLRLAVPAPDPRVAELEAQLVQLEQALQQKTTTSGITLPEGSEGSRETEQLAFEDSLTKLPNFNLLRRYLDFSLKQVDRYQRRCALIHVDVDRFQALNEALGSAAGDDVLRQVAQRLQKVVRTSDVLCRKSEDDFLILLSEVAGETDSPESIGVVIKRIQEMMQPSFQAANQPVLISCSLGISQFPSDAKDGDQMLLHSQIAMRRAKELGRNQAQFYTEELQKRHDARTTLENELRKGLEGRQFQLVYQPIVHLPTGAIKGVESLLRWNHPSYGILTPDYFLEVADESGLMVPLGRWVIQQAAQQLYEWSRQGLDLFVTVNLTTRQFMQADLVDGIKRALESTGAPAHNFVVEVPESVQMLDIQRVQTVLYGLRQAGVRVALDRFGSGFSSLERLHSELVTLLKIDRKFLFHSATNAAALNVTVAAVGLARGLRLRPVAVGVENTAQLNMCRQLECEYVQGNLVYVPTEAAQISELARSGRLLR